ncbi:hypothetical protein OSB04_007864 [Centaurea solstitialis]|uniref:GPI-anchored protein LLG1-like domain-containing protein n=1 Tax=Centaurea solstitialis TaxID=347529 RepID=A0AA38TMD7_9ASTR|nr:hypothetical protein OSB04_007864 [Centaurea solstitialis]
MIRNHHHQISISNPQPTQRLGILHLLPIVKQLLLLKRDLHSVVLRFDSIRLDLDLDLDWNLGRRFWKVSCLLTTLEVEEIPFHRIRWDRTGSFMNSSNYEKENAKGVSNGTARTDPNQNRARTNTGIPYGLKSINYEHSDLHFPSPMLLYLHLLLFSGFNFRSFDSSDLDGVFSSGASIGRNLLQAKKPCPVNFEFMNYTIITSRCKGPQYPPSLCCQAFKDFACPYAEDLNDLSNECSSTMFSYINLYGNYPPGLFSSLCRDEKIGLICPALAPGAGKNSVGDDSNSSHHIRNSPPLVMLIAGGLILAKCPHDSLLLYNKLKEKLNTR